MTTIILIAQFLLTVGGLGVTIGVFISKVNSLFEAIDHIKELFSTEVKHIKQDIKRLEDKQDKSNKVKERVVALEESAKSAHKRLDYITS